MRATATILMTLFLLLFFVACSHLADEPAVEQLISQESRILQFDTAQVKINLSSDWEIDLATGSFLRDTDRRYNFTLTAPGNEKTFGTVTIGNIVSGQPLPYDDFMAMHRDFTDRVLDRAVEDIAEYTVLDLVNGVGLFSILTDAALVGTIPPPDEFMYLGLIFGNYNHGVLVFATLLTDNQSMPGFTSLLDAIINMKVVFDYVTSLGFNAPNTSLTWF